MPWFTPKRSASQRMGRASGSSAVPAHAPSTNGSSSPQIGAHPAALVHRLETSLCQLGGNSWTIRDSVEGTQIFGGNGSGKTSGSGATIGTAFIRQGFGGLVLTAKPDDLQQWIRYCERAGLTSEQIRERFIVVQPRDDPRTAPVRLQDGKEIHLATCHAFNILGYEFDRGGRLTTDVVSLFLNAMSPGGTAVSSSDSYWDDALQELLTHAVDLAVLAGRARPGQPELLLGDIVAIIASAPQSRAEVRSPEWRKSSACWRAIETVKESLVKKKLLSGGLLGDFARAVEFWTSHYAALNDRTRTSIVSTFTAKSASLLHSPIKELLCGNDDPLACPARPEATMESGRIVVLNLPVKLYGDVGRFAQTLWKTVWQRAVERRTGKLETDPGQHPVFLWADEAQYFITREDALFQQTARSSMAATVFLTQNISNYYAAMKGHSAREHTDSLLGNLQTKIFHANGDPATNEWASRLFGKTVRQVSSRQVSYGPTSESLGLTAAPTMLPVVEAAHFATLRSGGPACAYEVDAWVFKTGRRWKPTPETEEALGYPEVPPHIIHCTFQQKAPPCP